MIFTVNIPMELITFFIGMLVSFIIIMVWAYHYGNQNLVTDVYFEEDEDEKGKDE